MTGYLAVVMRGSSCANSIKAGYIDILLHPATPYGAPTDLTGMRDKPPFFPSRLLHAATYHLVLVNKVLLVGTEAH